MPSCSDMFILSRLPAWSSCEPGRIQYGSRRVGNPNTADAMLKARAPDSSSESGFLIPSQSCALRLLFSPVPCSLVHFLQQLLAQPSNALDAATAARVDQAVEKVIADTGIPSASVALVQHGQIVYLQAYGKARLEPPMAATTEMQYSIGSVSKQFTAALILMLVEDGKMTLDDPVGKVSAAPDARERGDGARGVVDDGGISGLLARRLRDDDDDGADHGAAHPGRVGR